VLGVNLLTRNGDRKKTKKFDSKYPGVTFLNCNGKVMKNLSICGGESMVAELLIEPPPPIFRKTHNKCYESTKCANKIQFSSIEES
jgi:hypothetical protein